MRGQKRRFYEGATSGDGMSRSERNTLFIVWNLKWWQVWWILSRSSDVDVLILGEVEARDEFEFVRELYCGV